jgi:hypothetical protein
MQYLGPLRGTGVLVGGALKLGRVDFEFDAYLVGHEVVASGEIRMAPPALSAAFGRIDLSLQTDDGLTLGLRFSGKRPTIDGSAAHADVRSGLPEAASWRRQ